MGEKGHLKGHVFTLSAQAHAEVHENLGVVKISRMCTAHAGEKLQFLCATCGMSTSALPSLYCAICTRDHAGHSLVLIADGAATARAQLRYAASGPLEAPEEPHGSLAAAASRVSVSHSAGVALPSARQHEEAARNGSASAVSAVRAHALRVAAELESLDGHLEHSLQSADRARDALCAAAVGRCKAVRAEAVAAAEAARAALQKELSDADNLLARVSSNSERLLQVSALIIHALTGLVRMYYSP